MGNTEQGRGQLGIQDKRLHSTLTEWADREDVLHRAPMTRRVLAHLVATDTVRETTIVFWLRGLENKGYFSRTPASEQRGKGTYSPEQAIVVRGIVAMYEQTSQKSKKGKKKQMPGINLRKFVRKLGPGLGVLLTLPDGKRVKKRKHEKHVADYTNRFSKK